MQHEELGTRTNELGDVQNFRKITDRFRGMYMQHTLKQSRKNRKNTTRHQVDLETLGF